MAAETSKPQFVVTSARSLDDPNWTNRSVAAEDLAPQFSFSLNRTVYVGDPNSSEQFQSGKHDRSLSIPAVGAANPLRPTAAELRGHEKALAAYYREIMTLTGKRPSPGEVGYWLRLDFVSPAIGKEIAFPYWDRVSDAQPFLNWLRKIDAPDEFFDADQGWILRAAHKGRRLHFQYADLDTGEEFANMSVTARTFLHRLQLAEADVRGVILGLTKVLGVDPWS
jgi:hypothetical protein